MGMGKGADMALGMGRSLTDVGMEMGMGMNMDIGMKMDMERHGYGCGQRNGLNNHNGPFGTHHQSWRGGSCAGIGGIPAAPFLRAFQGTDFQGVQPMQSKTLLLQPYTHRPKKPWVEPLPRQGAPALGDPSALRRQHWTEPSSATLHLSFARFCDLRTCVKSSATINSNIQVWLFKLLFQKYFKMH